MIDFNAYAQGPYYTIGGNKVSHGAWVLLDGEKMRIRQAAKIIGAQVDELRAALFERVCVKLRGRFITLIA